MTLTIRPFDFSSGSYNTKWTNGQSHPTRVIWVGDLRYATFT